MRLKDREKAIELRKKKKMSYSQIKQTLGISKGTLSYWLRDYPLSEERIRALTSLSERRIERYRETMKKKKQKRWDEFYQLQKKKILPFTRRDLYIAGLFLYWGEGAKTTMDRLSISNSDPSVLLFFILWLTKSLKIPKEKLKVYVHLYSDMNIEKELNFWSKTLNISRKQFINPYIKESSSTRINHKGGFGHGTCSITVCNVRLAEETMMGIKVMGDYCNKNTRL